MKSFTDKLNGSDETLERFTDCLESLDGDSDSESEDGGSVSTAPTSLPSARYSGSSELSIKCRGLPSMNNGSSYIRTSVIPSLAEPFDPASPRIASSIDLQNWIESRESRCMSPGTEIEILDVSWQQSWPLCVLTLPGTGYTIGTGTCESTDCQGL